MRYLYTFLFYLVLPFVFLRLLWRSRHNSLYRQRFAERLGFYSKQLDPCIWVHAVSLGETIAAIPLIKALKKKYPEFSILVTNMTITGSKRVKEVFGESVYNSYIPYDLPDMNARFLKKIKPKILIVMETELWPNLFAACKKRNIPIIVTNARLSEKSAKKYRKIIPLMHEIFSAITTLSAQGETDAERFIALGLPKNRVHVTGSLKFDLDLPAETIIKGENLRKLLGEDRMIWIAASTHPGEDEMILAAHQLIREKIPQALLILVPRHPERFDQVAALLIEKGFMLARRSKQEPCPENIAIYLGDTMGEMMVMYSACDVAFVAGSFVAVGGHNVIEPAALHKPVITGPYLFNFAEITDGLLKAKGMVKVENSNELARSVLKFFEDADYRKKTGENAYAVVEKNRGALKRQLDLINVSIV
ncbi:MAG TPA: lipid IV(A) 3-deoxy-D-manno-octulosonic acid transferase [Gammaproteobacteria bacterium]|nr:lipid IV(A) 3-deoxy-D-manno-octulosonic acid transferase [Gammaproteobacteria bacterium]